MFFNNGKEHESCSTSKRTRRHHRLIGYPVLAFPDLSPEPKDWLNASEIDTFKL